MIPSTTKLALLSGIVLIFGGIAFSSPVKYDRRQEGPQNFAASVEDLLILLMPSRNDVETAVNLLALNTRNSENLSKTNFDKIPTRTASKLGFAPAEKSPYKVDLEKSAIPLAKVETPVVVEVVEIKNPKDIRPEIAEAKPTAEAKTVKKELKMEEKKKELSKNERDKAT